MRQSKVLYPALGTLKISNTHLSYCNVNFIIVERTFILIDSSRQVCVRARAASL